jgi:hypothetical protein
MVTSTVHTISLVVEMLWDMYPDVYSFFVDGIDLRLV